MKNRVSMFLFNAVVSFLHSWRKICLPISQKTISWSTFQIISSTNTCEPSDYASLKLMSFKHIHEYFSLIRFFKYHKLNESLNFKTKIENHQTNHSYNTRHSMARKLNCPKLRLSKLKTSFLYNSIKFWNKIPSDIKSAQNLNLFKKYLKESHIYEPNW